MRQETIVLRNNLGDVITLTNYGATLMSWVVEDRKCNRIDIVLGFNKAEDYLGDHPSFGCTVGRYANRIAGGTFVLDNQSIQLEVNKPPNHLHGGSNSLRRKMWDIEAVSNSSAAFSYFSISEESNYPGNLQVEVKYSLNDLGELHIKYKASSDANTICNLTNHAYFNLDGESNGILLDSHKFQMHAEHFLPIDENSIPTGVIQSVEGTVMDLREPTCINHEELIHAPEFNFTKGYDHNYVLGYNRTMRKAATVSSSSSGLTLECSTDKPGLQLYLANTLGNLSNKKGGTYGPYHGFCLEAQHFPDSPNNLHFPSPFISAGEIYEQHTVYKVSKD